MDGKNIFEVAAKAGLTEEEVMAVIRLLSTKQENALITVNGDCLGTQLKQVMVELVEKM